MPNQQARTGGAAPFGCYVAPMRLLKPALAIGSASIMVVGLTGPAGAGTRILPDAPRDAPKGADIGKVKYKHTKKGASAKIWVRGLTKSGEFVLAVGNLPGNTMRFGMTATRSGGKVTEKFYKSTGKNTHRKKCKGMKVTWRAKRNVVRLSFPLRCYKSLNKRVGIAAGSVEKSFPKGATLDSGPYAKLKR